MNCDFNFKRTVLNPHHEPSAMIPHIIRIFFVEKKGYMILFHIFISLGIYKA